MTVAAAKNGRQEAYRVAKAPWGGLHKRVAARAAAWAACCLGTRLTEAFGILMYHRVSPCHPAPSWNVSPQRFRRQLHDLRDRGYEPWPLRKLVAHSRGGLPIPRNVFAVTFDDGYESVYHGAWPVLKELDVPATIFLATGFLDACTPFSCDEWGAAHVGKVPCEAYRPLFTSQCETMLAEGHVDLGTHGHSHTDFRGRPDDFLNDLLVSLGVLRDRFGLSEAAFAFPNGLWDLSLAATARQAEVLCSLTTASELVLPGDDPFHWGRFTVEATDTGATLAGKLSGWYSAARGAWQRWLTSQRGGR